MGSGAGPSQLLGREEQVMDQDRVFAKIARRLIPFIFLLYLVNYIDRVNVGFAARIFFIGYLIFQVPGNLIMEKIGARRWVFWMLGIWGLISAANALIRDEYSYYVLRLFLGIAE